jgi:hypothetical protein
MISLFREISRFHGEQYEDVFWDVAPCSLAEIEHHRPGGGSSKPI